MRLTLFVRIPTLALLFIPTILSRLSQRSSHNHALSDSETLYNATEIGLTKRGDTKYVFMHHIVGNTYPYTLANWKDDVAQIGAKGVDAIALNIGPDKWQRDQVRSAYKAAEGTNVKIFISFDYSVFDCSTASTTIEYFNEFKSSSSQFYYNGRPMLSSYAGSCLSSSEWRRMKAETGAYLMPFMWGLEGQFNDAWSFLDSWLCWGCAWPQTNEAKTTADDRYYISQLGSRYATTVSMWMYTHYTWANKNFYQRGDDWLIANRWEQLVEMRNELTFVEMVTWNDWGESDYFGPFGGAQPEGTYWAKDFPHTAFFDLSQYYITAFKTGTYPTITQDAIYFWARPHPYWADAPQDPIGVKPNGYDWATEYMFAVVMATSDATVTLGIGSYREDFQVKAGASKLRIGLYPGQMMVQMVRNGKVVVYQNPTDFAYSLTTDKYNYNVYSSVARGGEVTTPTVTVTAIPSSTSTTTSSSKWSYFGCYPEGTTGTRRALTSRSYQASNMTPNRCKTFCKGYAYAGVENGTECYCGKSLTRNGATGKPIDSSKCAKPCGGSRTKICGGEWTLSVYGKGTPPVSVPVSAATWTSRGCYTDSSDRLLRGASTEITGMTTETCIQYCADHQYTIAATEYGYQCMCGDVVYKTGGSGVAVAASQCSMPCEGDSSQKCGDGWRANVYTAPGIGLTRRDAAPTYRTIWGLLL